MSETIESRMKDVIVNSLGVDEVAVKPDAKFIEDLGADSLDIVELVMVIEETFGIEIPDEDAENIKSVNDAVQYVKKSAN